MHPPDHNTAQIEASKSSLRELMRETRRAVDFASRERASRALAVAALRERVILKSSRVAAFWALDEELGTHALVDALLARGKRVFLPRVVGPGEMFFIEVHAPVRERLMPGPWGLLEPVGEVAPLEVCDLVLVPGVAFDRYGGRVGMGGGFYDRALAASEEGAPGALWLGVGYDFQIVDGRAPLAPHDRRVAGVLTPQGLIRCG